MLRNTAQRVLMAEWNSGGSVEEIHWKEEGVRNKKGAVSKRGMKGKGEIQRDKEMRPEKFMRESRGPS